MLLSFHVARNGAQTHPLILGSAETNAGNKAHEGAQISSRFSLLIKAFPATGTKLHLIAPELQPLSAGSLSWACPQAIEDKVQSHFFGHSNCQNLR